MFWVRASSAMGQAVKGVSIQKKKKRFVKNLPALVSPDMIMAHDKGSLPICNGGLYGGKKLVVARKKRENKDEGLSLVIFFWSFNDLAVCG